MLEVLRVRSGNGKRQADDDNDNDNWKASQYQAVESLPEPAGALQM